MNVPVQELILDSLRQDCDDLLNADGNPLFNRPTVRHSPVVQFCQVPARPACALNTMRVTEPLEEQSDAVSTKHILLEVLVVVNDQENAAPDTVLTDIEARIEEMIESDSVDASFKTYARGMRRFVSDDRLNAENTLPQGVARMVFEITYSHPRGNPWVEIPGS